MGEILQTAVASVVAGAWSGVAILVVVLLTFDGLQYLKRRRAIVEMMQRFGERFVYEFERPLKTPGSEERPVESQLRFIPRRQRLEIMLAPTGRRRYPNLSDHRGNVAYDAERIVRLLKDKRFVGGQLSADGKWVVIACDFEFFSGIERAHVNILLLSLGGGGGNILRSAKELFSRDLAVTQKTDGKFADRLRRAVTTRFLDTNEFSLSGVPREERLLIGEQTTGRLGARHNPAVAAQALEESRAEVEALLSRYSA